MRSYPDLVGMRRGVVWGVFLLIPFHISYSADADSLQVRLYHGLDEMGAGNTLFYHREYDGFSSSIRWNTDVLHRRPMGSQAEYRISSEYSGQLGRVVLPNLDIKGVFEGDFYRFQRLSGPSPQPPYVLSPPQIWELSSFGGVPSIPLQHIDRSLLGIGGTFKPDTLLILNVLVGQQWERREAFDDKGVSASLDASLQGFDYKGYQNDLNIAVEQEELGARLNREMRFQYGLRKDFSPSSSDHLEIYYRQKRYDYHIGGSSAIGTRTDTDQLFRNQLRYDLHPQLGFLLETDLSGSRHEDRTPTASAVREDIGTSNALILHTSNKEVSGWLKMKFDWGAQEDATGLKRERGTSLENGLCWTPSTMDSLNFVSAVRKRQYDTSDTSNYDDRDRLRYEFYLSYGHEFSPKFRLNARSQVILEHLVYIFSEKSDQNNWNRIVKLGPEVYFEPLSSVHNVTSFELVANTTDYDFELDPSFIKSTIYRRYTASDSLVWVIQRGWSVMVKYSLDLEDGGRFIWDDWVQQISEEYRTHRAALLVMRETRTGIRLDAGASIYERKGWEYTLEPVVGTVKSPFMYLSRWGPLLQFSYPSSLNLRIEAAGDLSWVHEWGQEDYTIVNLDVRLTWR